MKRDGRKGDPQQKYCGNNRSEWSEAVNHDASETPGLEAADRQFTRYFTGQQQAWIVNYLFVFLGGEGYVTLEQHVVDFK